MRILLNDTLVDTDANRIGQGPNSTEVESQSMAVLAFLISYANTLVSRETLFNEVWQGKVVTDNSLHRVIAQLRKALGDDTHQPLFIKTVHGKGYILVAKVSRPKQPKYWRLAAFALAATVLLSAISSQSEQPLSLKYLDSGIQTSLSGIEYQPQLSIDGSALLFVHRPNLAHAESYLMRKDITSDEPSQVYSFQGRVNALSWSDDKLRVAIAIQQEERCQVFALDLAPISFDAERATRLFSCIPHSPLQLAWSQAGDSLFVLKADSTDQFKTQLSRFHLASKQFSMPFGKSLIELHGFGRAATSDQLMVYKRDQGPSTRLWRLDPGQQPVPLEPLNLPLEQLSQLAGQDSWIALANDRLHAINLDGDSVEIKDSFRLGIGNISLASDGLLVFNTDTSRYRLSELNRVLDLRSAPYQESSLNQAAASYHPNGQTSAFLSDRRGRGWELWLAENGKSRPLALPDHELRLATPQWRPDGNGLLLLSAENRLLQLELNGQQASFLTDEEDIVLAGSWADSQSIYFSKLLDNQFQLFHLDLKSKQEKQLTRDGGYFAQRHRNGKHLYFSKRNLRGLWRLELSSGDIELIYNDFGADNYSRWQLVADTLYFRHHPTLGLGLFKYELGKRIEPIQQAEDIWLFNISPDQSKILLTRQELAYADIKYGYLKRIEQ